ncbi:hypothetical protein [Sporomusa malonica]|uniref:Uncharacterized protein n=1 Tax=Sporomusa malonica TaxID=112901 RepID=A0A1W2B3V2_9FIRM|nr:hypothetical protein [Sporomusa malonica]SMC67524.1 hypothetical protein SAMN04488500_106300 [Sporomusa malonica]
MFNFIKKLFARPTRPDAPKKQLQQPITSFDDGADHQSTDAVWGQVWLEALSIDERFINIDSGILLDIEQRIKKGIIEGTGSRQMAAELRPTFESIGLTRKDALNLATTATNLVYEKKQACLVANFAHKDESVETSAEFVKRARKEYVKKARCFK